MRPRLVTISREPQIAAGNVGYRAMLQSQEVVVFTDIPASIQYVMRGPDPVAKVPSDRVGRGLWRAFLEGESIPTGSIHRDDIMTDDLGRRWKVNEPSWGSLNIVQLEAELLAA